MLDETQPGSVYLWVCFTLVYDLQVNERFTQWAVILSIYHTLSRPLDKSSEFISVLKCMFSEKTIYN